jgi:putative membrane protein
MRRTLYLVVLLVLGLLLTPSPSAQTTKQSGSQTGQQGDTRMGGQTGTQTQTDRDKNKKTTGESAREERYETHMGPAEFLRQAMIGNLTEIKLGQLAEQRAASPQVKQLAQQMVDAHTKANDQIQPLAKQKNAEVPTDLDRNNKRTEERLSKLNGDAFDRAYLDVLVKNHREDVERFTRESKTGKDTEVRDLASKMLPDLQHHLQMAQDTRQQVAGTKTTTTTKSATKAGTKSTTKGKAE